MTDTELHPLALPSDALPTWPQYDDAERAGLIRALEQGAWWRVTGSEVTQFESEFASYNGAPFALAVTNGTGALELALRVHGIGPGDEVVVPAFTFISTALAVQNVGAVPVAADIAPSTYCLTVDAARAALSERTRVVIPVHMAGHTADTEGLHALCNAHGLVLVHDAAHAPGAVRSGVGAGGEPAMACFSFQNGKLMTAGEGGALTLPDAATYERAYLMHTCGRPVGDVSYRHLTGGSNYRMTEFAAAVLRAQLGRLAAQTAVREERATLLDELFAGVRGVSVQGRDPQIDVNPHYMYLLTLDESFGYDDRNRLVELLTASGVPACVNFPPVYRTAAYWAGPAPRLTEGDLAARCPVAEAVGSRGLWLHHRILLAEPDVLRRLVAVVADKVERVRHDSWWG